MFGYVSNKSTTRICKSGDELKKNLGKGMLQSNYDWIIKHIDKLNIDIKDGIILNRKCSVHKSTGYRQASLMNKTFHVHQIIAVARWGKKCVGMTVNHINKDKKDNSFNNIELMTLSENVADSNTSKMITWKKKVKAINIDTDEEFIFNSRTEASLALGLRRPDIVGVLKGKCKRCGRFAFENVEETS